MSKPVDQFPWPAPEHRPSVSTGSTKQRIIHAAIELIAERGWGGVTTRAVAERAEVLNGVVSYHFDGKADLLRQAALTGVVETIGEPVGMILSAPSISGGLRAMAGWLHARRGSFPDFALMAESMLGAQRDPALQQSLAAVVDDFRGAVATKLDRSDAAAARAEAAVITSALDGLILHRLLDPQFDPVPALERLADLFEQPPQRTTKAGRRSSRRARHG